jgi:tripartite-type tricarboxylate transporter receptor subunit TctC
MEMMTKLACAGAVVILSALALSGTASPAQPWPQRMVKLMVPLGPGSGADVTARLLADHLSKHWGQPVIVENRPGADGIIGLTAYLTGTDDHVLLFTPTGTFTSHPFLHEKLPTIRTN